MEGKEVLLPKGEFLQSLVFEMPEMIEDWEVSCEEIEIINSVYKKPLEKFWTRRKYVASQVDPVKLNEYSSETKEFRFVGETIVIHTDASVRGNGSQFALGGIGVFFGKDSPHNRTELIINPDKYISTGVITNNTAEIVAVIRALEIAFELKLDNVEIRTDCGWIVQYFQQLRKDRVYRVFNNKAHNFKIDLKTLYKLEEAAEKIRCVEFSFVEGHGIDKGNIQADSLAKEAVDKLLDQAVDIFFEKDEIVSNESLEPRKKVKDKIVNPKVRMAYLRSILSSLTEPEYEKLCEILVRLPINVVVNLVFPDFGDKDVDHLREFAECWLDQSETVKSSKYD